MTIRIWTRHNNSWARIPVSETPIHLDSGGPHEEGYSYTRESFWIDGPWLYVESSTNARDCDGRLDSFSERRAPLSTVLHIGSAPHFDRWASVEPVSAPRADRYAPPDGRQIAWERVDSSQRDYSAEAMGY